MQQEHGDEVFPGAGSSRLPPVDPGQAMPLQLNAKPQAVIPTSQ